MNLHLTGHHVEITSAIREYVVSKISRIQRHFEHVIDVNVVMTVEKLDQIIRELPEDPHDYKDPVVTWEEH